MIQGATGMYKAFLIVELPGVLVKAYRNPMYLASGTVSYEAPGWLSLSDMIDKAGDVGEFTDDQYRELTGKEPEFIPREDIAELIRGLPFMPEPGPPVPGYVSKEVFGLENMEAPVSEYGRALASEVLKRLKEFLGTDFTVAKDFEETGWASDGVMYSGVLKHVLTNTEWFVEMGVSFEWRKPEEINMMYLEFFAVKQPDGTWADVPPEVVDSEEFSFDLNADEGRKASLKMMELREKVRSHDGSVQ